MILEELLEGDYRDGAPATPTWPPASAAGDGSDGPGLHVLAGSGVGIGTPRPFTSDDVDTGVTGTPVHQPSGPAATSSQMMYGYGLFGVQPLYAHTA